MPCPLEVSGCNVSFHCIKRYNESGFSICSRVAFEPVLSDIFRAFLHFGEDSTNIINAKVGECLLPRRYLCNYETDFNEILNVDTLCSGKSHRLLFITIIIIITSKKKDTNPGGFLIFWQGPVSSGITASLEL